MLCPARLEPWRSKALAIWGSGAMRAAALCSEALSLPRVTPCQVAVCLSPFSTAGPRVTLVLGTQCSVLTVPSLPSVPCAPQLLCRLVYKEILAWKVSLSRGSG